MFSITKNDIQNVLKDYGIDGACTSFCELQRYHYEKDDPASKQVRLIIRADLANGASLVIRFKNEDDAPYEIIEAQSRFANLLFIKNNSRHSQREREQKEFLYGRNLFLL